LRVGCKDLVGQLGRHSSSRFSIMVVVMGTGSTQLYRLRRVAARHGARIAREGRATRGHTRRLLVAGMRVCNARGSSSRTSAIWVVGNGSSRGLTVAQGHSSSHNATSMLRTCWTALRLRGTRMRCEAQGLATVIKPGLLRWWLWRQGRGSNARKECQWVVAVVMAGLVRGEGAGLDGLGQHLARSGGHMADNQGLQLAMALVRARPSNREHTENARCSSNSSCRSSSTIS
jgi:hypothetical protein